MTRSEERKLALFRLYQTLLLKEPSSEEYQSEFEESVLCAFDEHTVDVEEMLLTLEGSFPLGRISTIDRACLYLALIEAKYLDTPCEVAINESVELSKIYGDGESYKLVNSMLGRLIG